MKRVCFVTGARAEYGLLSPIIKAVKDSEDLQEQIVATGMHMSPAYGNTLDFIYEDGFEVDMTLETLISSDTSVGMSKTFGLAAISLADAYRRLSPDMVVLLGDRYETLSAACIASIQGIPIAHVHGGELTYGAIDDSFRHAITKLSTLHFTSTENYRNRVIQMGESPDRVFNAGAVGIDIIKNLDLVREDILLKDLNISGKKGIILITYHPETRLGDRTIDTFKNLLDSLKPYADEYSLVFTGANCDEGGNEINTLAKGFVRDIDSSYYFINLGNHRYLSLLSSAKLVIGNSSSGILEAPFLGTPTINIGDRQRGRIRPGSVVDCSNDAADIARALEDVLLGSVDLSFEDNPYIKDNTSRRIVYEINRYLKENVSGIKEFYDIH